MFYYVRFIYVEGNSLAFIIIAKPVPSPFYSLLMHG